MSVPEFDPGEPLLGTFAGSKVKLIRNTRGVNWEISVAEGTPAEEMDRLRELAVAQHTALERQFPDG